MKISEKLKSFYNIVDILKLYNFAYEIRDFQGNLLGKYIAKNDVIHIYHGAKSLWTTFEPEDMKEFIIFNDYFYNVGLGYITAIPCCITTIQRAWRKWYLKVCKNRLDPIKRDLMGYIYHPSRMDFLV